MPSLDCHHESEGFCMFEGLCPYQIYISHAKRMICKEWCEQYIADRENEYTQIEIDGMVEVFGYVPNKDKEKS